MQGLVASRSVAARPELVRRLPALAVIAFGVVLLYGVGFSTITIAHNATHDTRHATGFPCH